MLPPPLSAVLCVCPLPAADRCCNAERNDSIYFFAEHARQLVGADDFRRIANE
eukprot:SAG22_NODE_16204_length_331_cov_0.396552_2_plen_52_part_01